MLLSVPFSNMEAEAKSEAETAEKAAETCLKYGGWSNIEKADFLKRQIISLREKGEIKAIQPTLKRFVKLINKSIKSIQLVEQAKQVILDDKNDDINRDISVAKQKFNQAKKLDPNIELEEDKKEIAQTLIERGVSLVKADKIDQALIAYQKAQEFDPNLEINVKSWNSLCRFGSLNRKAKEVLFACENAVNYTHNIPMKAIYTDSRGLARALTGDFDGAIKDFQVFIDDSDENDQYKNQRKQWIENLKKGENTFTDEVLEELKNEG